MSSFRHLVVSLTILSCLENYGTFGGTTIPSNTPASTASVLPIVNFRPTPVFTSTPYPVQTTPRMTQLILPVTQTTLPPNAAIPTPRNPIVSRPNTPTRVTTTLPVTASGADSPPNTFAQSMLSTTSLPVRTTRLPTRATTDISNVTQPPGIVQRCQLTFGTKYADLATTSFDVWVSRPMVVHQLAVACQISDDRISDIAISQNSTGYLVIRFSIQQGWPVLLPSAVQNLQSAMNQSNFLQISGQWLDSPEAVFWTDNGPCPDKTCMESGTCNITTDGDFTCACVGGYSGRLCDEAPKKQNTALFALLVLLVIPIAIAVIVGFIFGRRRQEKKQLKKAFDLRDVRTIGPRSMLSLPQEPGMRNEMYDTRSFALAFTDTSFGKSGTYSSDEPLSAIFASA